MPSVIEIGVGGEPYFARYGLPGDEDLYVGVDKDADRLREAERKFAHPARHFLVADATALPFDDGSFDVAVLSNVLSAPIHHDWDLDAPEHTVRGFESDLFYRERNRVAEEALRVLRPGGRLLIYTDLIVYGTHAFDAVIRGLRDAHGSGFRMLTDEQARIDALNDAKVRSGDYCHCFLADLLPKSTVYEIAKPE